MNRYISSRTIQNNKNKNYLSTSLLPIVNTSSEDVYIEITNTDRLDNLSQKFYNDVTKWPILAVINGLGKGTLYVKPGTILRIPPLETFENIISELNSNR